MKKVFIITFICLFIFSTNAYSKYKFEYVLECYDLIINKDEESPTYEVFYSTKNWTNKDVLVKIKFSEQIEGMEEFKYNNGIYEKVCSENQSKEILVKDLAGNETIVKYQINNIDKIPPVISGIENDFTYNVAQKAEYIDKESGIESVEKIFYGDLLLQSNEDFYSTSNNKGIDINLNSITLNVIRAPKNIVKYKYYRIESEKENYILSNLAKIVYKNNSKNNYKYYVIGIDANGNEYKSNVIERRGGYFENIILNKNNEMADISILGLDNNVSKIIYEITNLENDKKESNMLLNNNLKFYRENFDNANKYKISLKFFDKEKLLDERFLYINLNENYVEENKNTFSKDGNYDIKIKDKAGNETMYTIKINR